MSTPHPDDSGPVLFCFDGSTGSRRALATCGALLSPGNAVVLTVWETIATRLSTSGLYTGWGATYIPDEGDLDAREEVTARESAAEGARAAQERGWATHARTEQAELAVWQTI